MRVCPRYCECGTCREYWAREIIFWQEFGIPFDGPLPDEDDDNAKG